MKAIVSFFRFWYDFIVGDDWRIALVVVCAVGLTWALTRASINAWWLLPLAVLAVLSLSLRSAARATRK